MTYVDDVMAVLRGHNAAAIFEDVILDKELPLGFDIYLRECLRIYDKPTDYGFHLDDQLIPLFDTGNFDSFIFYNCETKIFEQRYLETPNEVSGSYGDWGSILSWLFDRMSESMVDDDMNDLLELSILIGYQEGITWVKNEMDGQND